MEMRQREDRKKREKAEAVRQRALEQFGLAHASLASFTLDALVAERAATVSVMRHGVIVESGRPEAIFAKPAHDYTRALLDAVPRLP